jgi:flagellar basal body P-ring protein FlgI
LREAQTSQSTAKLDQLVSALKQLRVPPEGIIEVLRELSKTGKLHAIYEEY